MKVRKYLKRCDEIVHTTLDPKGPGVLRIHLIPPKKLKPGIPWVVILNGYSLLPLQTSWAILLREFILSLNETKGNPLTNEDEDRLIKKVIENVKKIFPKTQESVFKKDLKDIISTFKDIINQKEPSIKIGYLTLAKYSKYMSAPHRMDLMISSMEKNGGWNCNQKCLHCYAANEKLSGVEELTTNDWKEIIQRCKKARIPSLTFTGGEPTLREDLVELVEHAKWFVTRLNTNGIRLTKELCKNLYAASLDSVQVTLYSYKEEIHNQLVGGNHFRQTIEGIKNALESGLDVSINTPLCNLNKNYVETIRFANALGVKYFSCSGLIPSGDATKNQSKITRLSNNEILNVIKEAYNFTKQNEIELSFTSPGFIKEEEFRKMKMVTPSCGACLSNMAIAPNGEVLPCQSWLFEEGLGNMLTEKWTDIWNKPRTKEHRKQSSRMEQKCPLHEVIR